MPTVTVRRYRPAYFVGFEDEFAEASSHEELLAIPWIHQWADEDGFHRFSVTECIKGTQGLVRQMMAETNAGLDWYVIGTIMADATFGLPTWSAPR
jgi:hypothetical protein